MADLDQRFDVVIVGAGVAGALVAWRLGEVGLKVALIEAGAAEVDRTAAVNAWGAAANKSLGSPYPGGAPGPEHADGPSPYYDQAGPENFLSTYERIAGGSTWHWLGHTPRLLPNDFRMASRYGVAVDWPIGYDDLEPWYCEAEVALGVAGDDEAWANVLGAVRSRPFPMPPIWPSWSDTYVAHAVDGLMIDGQRIAVLATPAARNSRPYDGRPPCAGNASCIPICPIGAKYDGFVHVVKARATGAVEMIAPATATRLYVGEGARIEAVLVRLADGSTGAVKGADRGGGRQRHRVVEAAVAVCRLGPGAKWRGQQQRPGRPQSDGPHPEVGVRPGARSALPLPRSALDGRYRGFPGRPVPQGAQRHAVLAQQRRLGAPCGGLSSG
jgi:choline dehydrogenase-like flavoprotein